MNDLLNDINELEKAKNMLDITSISKDPKFIDQQIQEALLIIRKKLAEKLKMVDNFEKQAPQDIQDLCLMIRGGK